MEEQAAKERKEREEAEALKGRKKVARQQSRGEVETKVGAAAVPAGAGVEGAAAAPLEGPSVSTLGPDLPPPLPPTPPLGLFSVKPWSELLPHRDPANVAERARYLKGLGPGAGHALWLTAPAGGRPHTADGDRDGEGDWEGTDAEGTDTEGGAAAGGGPAADTKKKKKKVKAKKSSKGKKKDEDEGPMDPAAQKRLQTIEEVNAWNARIRLHFKHHSPWRDDPTPAAAKARSTILA